MSQRIIAFDLMRAIMLFLLVAFHAGISFMNSELNPTLWFFKDSSTHIFFDGLIGFIHTFRHPAFFVISGYVTHQMFQKYSWKEVLSKRFKRLFIPMLITIVLMGPLVYILCSVFKNTVS
jgi:glucan biosynthesis protein C